MEELRQALSFILNQSFIYTKQVQVGLKPWPAKKKKVDPVIIQRLVAYLPPRVDAGNDFIIWGASNNGHFTVNSGGVILVPMWVSADTKYI